MYSTEWLNTNRVKLYVHIFFRVSIILILNVTSSRNLHCGRNNHNLQGKKLLKTALNGSFSDGFIVRTMKYLNNLYAIMTNFISDVIFVAYRIDVRLNYSTLKYT